MARCEMSKGFGKCDFCDYQGPLAWIGDECHSLFICADCLDSARDMLCGLDREGDDE